MEQTETQAPPSGRPRPWLLIALAVAVGLYFLSGLWSGSPSAPQGGPSNAARPAAGAGQGARVDPAELDVNLEALDNEPPPDDEGGRNPFRFQPKPAPPEPPPSASRPQAFEAPPGPPVPPPPPPIPWKFIGIVEPKPGDRVAAFSDCRLTMYGREGDVIDGRYRLVKIGVESVVMEYLDGQGRQTIRLTGQECVGK